MRWRDAAVVADAELGAAAVAAAEAAADHARYGHHSLPSQTIASPSIKHSEEGQ